MSPDDLFESARRRERDAERSAQGAELKADGMHRVDMNANANWQKIMYGLVFDVASMKKTFTADDVWELADQRNIEETTHDNRAFGPVMARASRDKICRKAGVAQVPSRRPNLHQTPLEVWESLIIK